MNGEIKVICSSSLTTSTKNAIKTIKPFCNDLQNRFVIVVPDRYSLITENMIFDELNIEAFFTISVKGISQMAREILDELSSTGQLFDKQQSLLAIRFAIAQTKNQFVCFNKKYNMDFCNEIFNTISQLKSNQITPEMLQEQASTQRNGLKEKLNDIFLIYSKYEEILNGRLDSSYMLTLLTSMVDKSEITKQTNYLFVGFDALTKQGYSLLGALSKNCKTLTVATVKKSGLKNDYICDEELLSRLKKLANEEKLLLSIVECEEKSTSLAEHIKQNLFLSKPNLIRYDNFSLIECTNINEEIEKLCKNIKKLLLAGARFKDINIVYSGAVYSRELEEKLEQMGFSLYIDTKVSLMETSPAKMLINLLSFYDNPYFISYLTNSISYDFLDLDKDSIFELNMLIENYGINGVDFLSKKFESSDKVKEIISSVNSIYEEVKKCETINSFIEFSRSILERYNIKQKLENASAWLNSQGKQKNEKIYLQAYSSIMETFDSFEMIKDEQISLQDFIDLLKFAFTNRNISSVPIVADSIFAGNISESFFENRKYMFVLGVNQNEMPVSLSSSGLISDSDIQDLALDITPTVAMINRRNKYKLYDTLQKAQDGLYLSYCIMNDEGKKAFASSFALRLLESFMDLSDSPKKIEYAVYDSVYYADQSESQKNQKLLYNAPNLSYAKREMNRLCSLNLNSNARQILYSAIKNNEPNYSLIHKNEKVIDEIEDVITLFFEKNYTKISQLEKYFQCPYAHFIDYGLKLKEVKTAVLDARTFGTLLHSVAENFLKQNLNNFGIYDDKKIEEISSQLFDEILAQKEYSRFLYRQENRVTFWLLKKEAVAFCKALATQQNMSDFKPSYYEKMLDGDAFKLGDKVIKIKGVVDRIDTCDDYFRIIDYKSGNIDSNFSSLYYGQKIQMFIYQRLVQDFLTEKTGGLFYYKVKNIYETEKEKPFMMKGYILSNFSVANKMDNSFNMDNPKSDLLGVALNTTSLKQGELKLKGDYALSEQELKGLENYSYAVCQRACEEISTGYITPNPTNSACAYCKYNCACGFDKSQTAKMRKQPAVAKKDILEAIDGI